ncbi:serine/threonine protein kinase [Actinomadura craniellae]|uniref:Serine/threonine protein kinase n=1 Tax=Actinomadura craniellae TaxID=2231787 RepID=A0A365HA92_9ACTN|nr:protein kinase [Actinomadura craniellae]RAY15932.1 serine/threonine protein kinase [Actinomadura craniellae]
MKRGDVIQGYRIVTEPTNEGGGKCVWAFAERAGGEFFIKRFLEPKRPREGSGGSATSRRLRLEECAEFEQRHRTIMERLRPDADGAGNLVLAADFFHAGSTYYKVTERVDTTSLVSPHSLDTRRKVVLLRTLALSLRLLHGIGVVHGDLKPANVLVQQKAANAFYTAKLIDFDDSYLSGSPPDPGIIAGDSFFGAPEWLAYLRGDETADPGRLTTKADMFSLGLMAHQYLTGSVPRHDGEFGSPAEAANAGAWLSVDERLTPAMQSLLLAMVSPEPEARPDADDFLAALRDPDVCLLGRGGEELPHPPQAGKADGPFPGRASRVRINVEGR